MLVSSLSSLRMLNSSSATVREAVRLAFWNKIMAKITDLSILFLRLILVWKSNQRYYSLVSSEKELGRKEQIWSSSCWINFCVATKCLNICQKEHRETHLVIHFLHCINCKYSLKTYGQGSDKHCLQYKKWHFLFMKRFVVGAKGCLTTRDLKSFNLG